MKRVFYTFFADFFRRQAVEAPWTPVPRGLRGRPPYSGCTAAGAPIPAVGDRTHSFTGRRGGAEGVHRALGRLKSGAVLEPQNRVNFLV